MYNDHGDDIQVELKANFSSNIWYGADNTALYSHLSSKLPTVRRYPEFEAESLKLLLAQMHEIDTNQISITNGSIESLYNIAQAYQNKKSLIITPTFSEYAKACVLNNHTISNCEYENLEKSIAEFLPDLVWICNPNNPTGHHINTDYLRLLFRKFKNIIFIIDQSYKDFCYQQPLVSSDISANSNIILIHSLTKRYSIPGLRIGCTYANKNIILKINSLKIPWSVNTLAIEAAKYILSNETSNFNIKEWLNDSFHFQAQINEIGNYECIPSQTPFFLVKLLKGRAANLKEYLLSDSILIRNANNIMNNNSEYIRLVTLSKAENITLIKKLIEWNQFI